MSLIVCNMPIVACAAYRAFQRARGVPPGTVAGMPSASKVPNRLGGPGLESFSDVSRGPGDTRLTYEDLTRITMSYAASEAWCVASYSINIRTYVVLINRSLLLQHLTD